MLRHQDELTIQFDESAHRQPRIVHAQEHVLSIMYTLEGGRRNVNIAHQFKLIKSLGALPLLHRERVQVRSLGKIDEKKRIEGPTAGHAIEWNRFSCQRASTQEHTQ